MKILIIGFSKLKYMPYMHFYLDNINRDKNDIHILYWNRDLKDENITQFSDCTLHEFRVFQKDEIPIYKKVGSFLKYRKFASNIISKNNYDFIIVLHTLPGVLIFDTLLDYKNNYLLDYRDSTYEEFKLFKYVIGKLVKRSASTFVSSDGFRKYLPKIKKLYTSHNILLDSLSHQEDKELFGIKSDKIRIAFWGFIRHKEVNAALIERLANDERFELHYYGREQQIAFDLKNIAKNIEASNIYFHGEYKPEERYEFLKTTDIIHNIYKDMNMLLAMGNKFYDGIVFRIPQICMPESFMGEMCEKYGVGASLSPFDESFADDLADYYYSINHNQFKNSCRLLLSSILDEYSKGCDIIKSYVNG